MVEFAADKEVDCEGQGLRHAVCVWCKAIDGVGADDVVRPGVAALLHFTEVVFLVVVEVVALIVVAGEPFLEGDADGAEVDAIVLYYSVLRSILTGDMSLTFPPVCNETRCNIGQAVSTASIKFLNSGMFFSFRTLKSSVCTYEVKNACVTSVQNLFKMPTIFSTGWRKSMATNSTLWSVQVTGSDRLDVTMILLLL